MKSEKLKAFAKAVWAFCGYLLVPQWGNKRVKGNLWLKVNG